MKIVLRLINILQKNLKIIINFGRSLLNWSQWWNDRKFALTLFWQKFRESNAFTKISKVLIWRKNILVGVILIFAFWSPFAKYFVSETNLHFWLRFTDFFFFQIQCWRPFGIILALWIKYILARSYHQTNSEQKRWVEWKSIVRMKDWSSFTVDVEAQF